MKTTTTLLFLSFLVFAFSTKPLLGASDRVCDPVLDVAGEELQTGVGYYVLPPIWITGGLTIAKNRNGSLCPFSIVQSLSEVDKGHPLTFSPILDKEECVVRISTDIDIKFLDIISICMQSTVWQLGEYDPSVGRSFFTTAGVGGSIINRFRIEKHNGWPSLPTYKLVYCQGRMVCQNIGIFKENGIAYLALSEDPHVVVFSKAGGSHIKQITAAHQI